MPRQLHAFLLFLSIIIFFILIPAGAADTQGSSPVEVKPDTIGSFFGAAPFDPLQGSHKETWNSKMWENYGDGMKQEWQSQQWSRAPVTSINPFAEHIDLPPDPEPDKEQMQKINEWSIKSYKMTLQKLEEERKANQRGGVGYTEANVEKKLADAQAFNGHNEDALDSLNKALTYSKKEYNNAQMTKDILEKKSKVLTSLGRTAEAAQAKKEADNVYIAPLPMPPSEEEPISPIIAVIGVLCALFIFARKTRK